MNFGNTNYPRKNLAEVIAITEESQKSVRETLDKGYFHPTDGTVFKGLGQQDRADVAELLSKASLGKLIQEFLVSGTAGAANLIPDKIYDIMYTAAAENDLVPQCSPIVTCPGSALKVDVEVDGQYVAHYLGSGGAAPTETIQTSQVTITPKLFGIRPEITNELIEDSQFDVMEIHLRRAAEQMGEFSTHQWLAKMITGASTGADGTQNALTTGASVITDLGDLLDAFALNLEDGFISDVFVIGPGPISDIYQDASAAIYSDQFHTKWSMNNAPLIASEPEMFLGTFLGMKGYVNPVRRTTGDGALYLSSKWHSFVLNKQNASLTVRKRWLKIENYSDPVRDLVGAMITARQDSETIYNDASCEITEQ